MERNVLFNDALKHILFTVIWRRRNKFTKEPVNVIYVTARAAQMVPFSDGAVTMPSGNGLVGTGFASRYRVHSRAGF